MHISYLLNCYIISHQISTLNFFELKTVICAVSTHFKIKQKQHNRRPCTYTCIHVCTKPQFCFFFQGTGFTRSTGFKKRFPLSLVSNIGVLFSPTFPPLLVSLKVLQYTQLQIGFYYHFIPYMDLVFLIFVRIFLSQCQILLQCYHAKKCNTGHKNNA